MPEEQYDAFLLVSFGGPEGPDDVMPFLENVTRGRGVPRERLLSVAEHYQRFGGVSPINGQCRDLLRALERVVDLPLYWGNRNWHPFLTDTFHRMAQDGVKRAAAFITSAYSSASSCRQYLDDIARARAAVPRDAGTAPEIVRLRHFYDHPGFIETMAARVNEVLEPSAHLIFTAHSIPAAMAENAGVDGGAYEAQIRTAAGLVAQAVQARNWSLAWQSRSGPPSQPWLEPDICDHLTELAHRHTDSVVVVPIGFVSDHMEVVYDLDTEAADRAKELGMRFARAGTAGTHPRFVSMVAELLAEPAPPPCPAVCCIARQHT